MIEVICKNCKLTNLINPKIIHAEAKDPFQWHCTYCTGEIP